MDTVANLSDQDRKELFQQTAARRGLHPAIAEKDFWVCWVLMKLFGSQLANHLVFKGGTSLSKAHHLIERFSEDIDLVLNWELLGYGRDGNDPWQQLTSNTKLDQFNKQFNQKAAAFIASTLLPTVESLLESCSSASAVISVNDPQIIEIHYPAAFKLEAIKPQISLEIGPLASWVPSDRYSIRSFAAEEFPRLFDSPACNVTAIKAERTFWEKATILHKEANRTSVVPIGYSRHYYDLYQLSNSSVADNALADVDLLQQVVVFKQRFYRSTWARYELAAPGTFRLLPTSENEKRLKDDYRNMRPMFFKEPPKWKLIIDRMAELEAEINAMKPETENGDT